MNRRDFLKHVLGGTVAGALGPGLMIQAGQEKTKTSQNAKNIVLILADDLGASEIGVYGNTDNKTPNIDRLATEGAMFKTCWATPICSPSRAMIMTGKYATRTQWWHNSMRPYDWKNEPLSHLGNSHTLFSEALKRYGYATVLSGKWQLGGGYPTAVFDHGFDEYCIHHEWISHLPPGVKFDGFVSGPDHLFPGRTSGYWNPCIVENGRLRHTTPDDYGPDIFCNYLIDFIGRHRNQPFLAYYPMQLVHNGADPTCGNRECYVPVPELDEQDRPTGKRTPEGFKYNVEYMDHLVGRIIKALDEMGLRDNTVIIFAGDNGSLNNKAQPTEAGCRVPLICNCPGTIQKGLVSVELVDFSDILPTILDFANAQLPAGEEIDGHSFAPILRGDPNPPVRDWIFSYYAYQRMLRDKRWYLDGYGKFYDCGTDRTGKYYKEVTDSTDPEVLAARKRFENILLNLPTLPENHPFRQRYQKDFVKAFSEKYKEHQKKLETKQ